MLIGDNIYRNKDGNRRCKKCAKDRSKNNTFVRAKKEGRAVNKIGKEKTHCIRGHELSGENVRIVHGNSRQCRVCETYRYMKNRRKILAQSKALYESKRDGSGIKQRK